jgi:uncharacterized protein YjbJ (UPF0337 family)
MNFLKNFLIIALISFLTFACSERTKSQAEQIQGKSQEAVGDATGDNSLENEGKWNNAKGKLREKKEDVKDAISGN